MEISIKADGLDEVAQKLKGIPDGFSWAMRQSIKHALDKARTTASKEIRGRYSVRQASVLASIGKVQTSALWGAIHAQGARLRPADFTGVKVSSTDGVSIPWVKGKMARYPKGFRHGSADAPIYQREGKERYPIHPLIAPISVPEAMTTSAGDIEKHIEKATEDAFYSELTRLANFILSTGQVPKSRFSK